MRSQFKLNYLIGTLLFGPSSELANRNANGQLIHVDWPAVGVCIVGVPSLTGEKLSADTRGVPLFIAGL